MKQEPAARSTATKAAEGSCLMDESIASEQLVRLGLAQTDLLIEARISAGSFALFPRSSLGLANQKLPNWMTEPLS